MEEYNKFDQKVRTKLSEEKSNVPPELEALVRNRLKASGIISGIGPSWIFIMSSVIVFFGVGIYLYMSQNSDAKIQRQQANAREISGESIIKTGNKNTTQYRSDVLAMNTTNGSPASELPSSSYTHQQNKHEDIISNEKHVNNNSLINKKHENEIYNVSNEAVVDKQKHAAEPSAISENTNSGSGSGMQTNSGPAEAYVSRSNVSSPESISENKSERNSASGISEQDEILKANNSADASLSNTLNSENITADQNSSALASTSGAITATESEMELTKATSADPVDVSTEPDLADVNSETGIGLPGRFKQSLEAFGGFQWTTMQENSGAGGWNSEENSNHSKFNGGVKWNLYRGSFSLGAGLNFSSHSNRISTVYDTVIAGIPFSYPAHINTEFNVVDVPILVGYFTNVNRIIVHIETGMSISFIHGNESNLTIDSSGAEIKKVDQFSAAKSFNSFILQVSVLYPVSNNFSIFIQPAMNYGRTTIYRDLDQMINMYSIRGGVRWLFQL